MKRRVLLLNLALAAALLASGALLLERWRTAEARNAEILRRASTGPAAKAIELKNAPDTAVRAASYFEVAEKMLFSRDRNPTVVAEAPPEAKPMPALPSAFGVMDLGDGPVAFLAMKGEPQRGYRPGEAVGEFKLVSAGATEITFEWEGQQLTRKLDDLRGVSVEAPPAASSQAASPPARGSADAGQSPGSAAPSVSGRAADKKFGGDINASSRYCLPGDTAPEGTEMDGYRKVLRQTPFSTTCIWEKVQ